MLQYIKGKIFQKHLPNDASKFSAEACAINMALDLISESRNNKFIIFSDSLSVSESLKTRKFDYPITIKILCKLENLSNNNDVQIVRPEVIVESVEMTKQIKQSGPL